MLQDIRTGCTRDSSASRTIEIHPGVLRHRQSAHPHLNVSIDVAVNSTFRELFSDRFNPSKLWRSLLGQTNSGPCGPRCAFEDVAQEVSNPALLVLR